MRAPGASAFGVFHSTDLMFRYHFGALSGSAANFATSSRGQRIRIAVETSIVLSGRCGSEDMGAYPDAYPRRPGLMHRGGARHDRARMTDDFAGEPVRRGGGGDRRFAG